MRDCKPDDDNLFGGASKWRFSVYAGLPFDVLFGGVMWLVSPAKAAEEIRRVLLGG